MVPDLPDGPGTSQRRMTYWKSQLSAAPESSYVMNSESTVKGGRTAGSFQGSACVTTGRTVPGAVSAPGYTRQRGRNFRFL